MDSMERKAFIYAAAQLDGFTVDWQTGKLIAPKPK
jgi:hypothetical protein